MSADPNTGDRINLFAFVSYIPDPLAEFLNRLRQELVPNCFLRAHVTILPPRPIVGSSEEARACLGSLVSNFEPFEIELGRVEVFPVTDVIHIALRSGEAHLRKMHAAMDTGCLQFNEPFQYHPHITLAQNLKPDELDELIRVARQRWVEFKHPRSFLVEKLTFVQGTRWKEWVDLGEYPLPPNRA
ncbi:MAG: 2'-5' RNA ligase family protein [Bryobacteraceae bacterium]